MEWWSWVLIAIVILIVLPIILSAPDIARYIRISKM